MNEMDTRFANQYNIQWFPGHMTKTLRMMEQEIQHVDASLVLLDARIPLSSLNPEIERITDRKPKLYALNKADLADPAVTEEWIRYFRAADAGCVAISAKQKGGANAVKAAIEKELSGLLERRQNRGMGGAKTQVMLCGIPNVGKSTFINTFAGSARAKAADRPGVTKGKQWVSTEKFDLLDMPGVLWKKFDSKTIASNLAFIGSIKDDILDVEELAMNLLDEVRRNYPDLVAQRYKLDAETLALPPYELLEAIGRKRGLLVRGGEVNTERCAIMLVDEFRACKWGRISLERPPQRDDLVFSMDGHPIRRCGSQGQQKSFLVSLKFAQYELMKESFGVPPMLLLDDVFDKLDMDRTGNLLAMVAGNDFGQIFITDSNKVRLSGIVDRITQDRAYFETLSGNFTKEEI